MKLTVPHLKSGKCPKGTVAKLKGRTRREICYLRNAAAAMGKRHGMYGKKRK